MACTDTGLKTCDRPAVVTLKPLVRGGGKRWGEGGAGEGGEEEEEKIR